MSGPSPTSLFCRTSWNVLSLLVSLDVPRTKRILNGKCRRARQTKAEFSQIYGILLGAWSLPQVRFKIFYLYLSRSLAVNISPLIKLALIIYGIWVLWHDLLIKAVLSHRTLSSILSSWVLRWSSGNGLSSWLKNDIFDFISPLVSGNERWVKCARNSTAVLLQ